MTTNIKKDAINPSHYQDTLFIPKERLGEFIDKDGNLSLQYINIMEFTMSQEEFQGLLKGNIWKYLLRLGKKDESVQELGKSRWYLTYLINWFQKK
jgi:hypothetical protein